MNTLILEKGYAATTIQDITAHANVGHSTFYAHHGSKEALMLSGLQHLRAALLESSHSSASEKKEPVLAFSRVFFEHVHEYRDVLKALLAADSGPLVTRKIKRLLAEVVRQDFSRIKSDSARDGIPRDAVVQFTVDACFSILLWWSERNPRLPPAEVDAIFRRLTLPALAASGIG